MKLFVPDRKKFKSYEVNISGHLMEIREGNNTLRIDFEKLSATQYSFLINQKPYLIETFPTGEGIDVKIGHRRQVVPVLTEREKIARELFGATAGLAKEEIIKAPMPGLILKIEVEKGQQVKPGDPLVVMEAMKMENEIRAKFAGKVQEIAMEPNQTVEKGAVLIKIGKV